MSTERLPTAQLELLRQRALLTAATRRFFDHRGYLEVDTPALAPQLIPEPSIEVFVTEQLAPASGSGAPAPRPLYLVPSPELWMKRLLANGLHHIYQLCHCFRNVEEQGPWHRVEFTMLEWYTAADDYRQAASTCAALLSALCAALRERGLRPAPGIEAPLQVISMAELWQAVAGCDPAVASDGELRALAARLDVPTAAADSWEQLFHRIFLARVEPTIATDQPTVVLDYPARIRTLAATHEDGVHACRWELYLRGVEVANCFQEERDRDRLRQVIGEEAGRQHGARVPHRVDVELADAFAAAPACSGVAVGIERLFALLLGLDDVSGMISCDAFC